VPVLDQEEAAPFVPSTMTHVLRATGPAPAVVAAVRAAAADLDPDVPVARAETMTAIVSRAMARDTLVLTLVATAGGLAVLVGLVGLGGALAYSITERRRELGVRMALGASPGQLRWAVVRLPLIALTAGLAAGVPGAAALGAVFGSLLFEVEALDATSYLASASTLVATAAIALALPARRLRRISPVEALRAE
jgi:ABC-type antimicrobial peptide transport system permease subunit